MRAVIMRTWAARTILPMSLGVLFACGQAEENQQIDMTSSLLLSLPQQMGALERPAVVFGHKLHVDELGEDACQTCHVQAQAGQKQNFLLLQARPIEDKDNLVDHYHDTCINCHEQRAANSQATGPVLCGECHVERKTPDVQKNVVRLDRSLHARHVKAANDKCETCHHVYDDKTKKLVYKKDKEEGCRNCHRQNSVDDTPSLREASHTQCVACHLDAKAKKQHSGPERCEACHSMQAIAAIKPLENIPRLLRGQTDKVWMKNKEGKAAPVAFDHLAHEQASAMCSDCHHRALEKCDNCHSLTGIERGAHIPLETAMHADRSKLSCIGCHQAQTQNAQCKGCHTLAAKADETRSCEICHVAQGTELAASSTTPHFVATRELPALPRVGEDFPKIVQIGAMADLYKAAELPHAQIVERLDKSVRSSPLAMRFHGDNETLCAGCHHHSPVAAKPTACRTCHSEAATTRDKPDLKAAYHRQCIGCHQAMNIDKTECTDCHAKKSEESQP